MRRGGPDGCRGAGVGRSEKGKRKAGGACEVHPREARRFARKRNHMACIAFLFETAELAVLYWGGVTFGWVQTQVT